MARTQDRVMDELRAIRRKITARLLKAKAGGRELEEIRIMEREADRSYREAARCSINGRRRRR